jgi:hypothetical protein
VSTIPKLTPSKEIHNGFPFLIVRRGGDLRAKIRPDTRAFDLIKGRLASQPGGGFWVCQGYSMHDRMQNADIASCPGTDRRVKCGKHLLNLFCLRATEGTFQFDRVLRDMKAEGKCV